MNLPKATQLEHGQIQESDSGCEPQSPEGCFMQAFVRVWEWVIEHSETMQPLSPPSQV